MDPAGGGTDAPPFSTDYGGDVVNFAVQRHVFAAVDRLPPGSGVAIFAEDIEQGVAAPAVNELPPERLEFLQAFVRRLVPDGESILLVTQSDVPASAGLGGSGALGVAVVAALDRAFGVSRSPLETAQLANGIERIDLGYPGGDQDSMGAALGGVNHLEYTKGGGTVCHRIEVAESLRLAIEHDSLLLYTSEAHVSGNIHQDIKDSYALENSPTVAAMKELRSAAQAMAVALREGDLSAYLESLNRSCDNLYRLHSSCDSDAHRRIYHELQPYLLGRKTCGAGGGGFMLVHTRSGCRYECARHAEASGALVWPVTIDFEGVKSWEGAALEPERIHSYLKRCRE